MDEAIGVASQIMKRLAEPNGKGHIRPKTKYAYGGWYLCTTSVADILFQAGVQSVAIPFMGMPYIVSPETSALYFSTISKEKVTYYP